MNILLISPLGFPVNESTRYAGIEQLVFNYASELSKTHRVTVLGHSQSKFPDKVTLLGTESGGITDVYVMAEIKQYQQYQYILRSFDVIHDFSHQHYASRLNGNLPSLNIFWHAPNETQYPKAPYNIIGLSRWACRMFTQYYKGQKARYQQSICVDTSLYKPNGKRGDRFLTLGIMDGQKGNLEAARICHDVGVKLDIAGQPFNPDYVKTVLNYCDGERVKYVGEVSQEQKINLMQTCKSLIYVLKYPEVTSHKIQETMLCGAPIITSRIGALPEIVTHGIDGYLCADESEFPEAIKNVDKLNPQSTYEKIKATYSIENVCKNYEPLYKEVAEGLRW